jgi:hypothetical protein
MPAIWVQEESFPPREYWVGQTTISLGMRWFNQSLLTVHSPSELKGRDGGELSDYMKPVATAAWQFAHTLEIGDFVAIYSRRRGLYIGRIIGDYIFEPSDALPQHSRTIEIETYIQERWALPHKLWELFGGLSRLISDEKQVELIGEVLGGTSPKPPSTRHLLFDALGRPNVATSPVVGELVLAESEEEVSAEAFNCSQCGKVCTELLHIDLINSVISDSKFISWSALASFRDRLSEALDDGWFQRLPQETNLKVARRFLDILIEEWADDIDTPVLYSLRKGPEERWSWILVAFAADGGHPSSIDRAFPSRAEAEAYLPTLGCRTSADLGPEQLKALGVTDPDGHTL